MKKTIVSLMMILVLVTMNACVKERELSGQEIFQMVSPSVVEVKAESVSGTSTGSGFFYGDRGMIVTNYHVVDGCNEGYIKLADGSQYDILTIAGYDEYLDIALVNTSYKQGIPICIRTEPLETGEKVYALGNSLGMGTSFSEGVISSSSMVVEGKTYIQTTAPISEGNSGGPLIDAKGNVIGITTASFEDGQNMNLAISISEIANVDIFDIPKELEKIVAETDPFSALKLHILEEGIESAIVKGQYTVYTDLSSLYDDFGETMKIGYYDNDRDYGEFIRVSWFNDVSENSGGKGLSWVSIDIFPDSESCRVTCIYDVINEDYYAVTGELDVDQTSELPIKGSDVNIVFSEELWGSDRSNCEKDVISAIDEVVMNFNLYLSSHYVGVSAKDFGFQIN